MNIVTARALMSSPLRWTDVGVSVYPRLVFVFGCSSSWLSLCSGGTSTYVLSGPSGVLNESWYRTWTCLIKSRCSQFDHVFARHRISFTSKADSNGRVFSCVRIDSILYMLSPRYSNRNPSACDSCEGVVDRWMKMVANDFSAVESCRATILVQI